MAANLPGDLSAVGASDVERIIEPASAVTAKKKQKKKKPKKKATVGTEAEASLEISEAINASAALEKLKLDQTNISDSLITNGGPRNGNGNGNGKPTFWDTQPVPKDYDSSLPDGPIRPRPKLGPDELPPAEKLLDGFEWATLDLREPVQLSSLTSLLQSHYVSDPHSTFRLHYTSAFLRWALFAPSSTVLTHPPSSSPASINSTSTLSRNEGNPLHFSVLSPSGKPLAFLSGTPHLLRVRTATLLTCSIDFLCIHSRLRLKRLAPVLMRELKRRCAYPGGESIGAGVYSAGVELSPPLASCRYYHRPLKWEKLQKVGFVDWEMNGERKYRVANISLPRCREMQEKDVEAVTSLFSRYLERFEMAPIMNSDEVRHWFLGDSSNGDAGRKFGDRIVWAYVVESPEGKITDFYSFYKLESSVIGSGGEMVNAAYWFYYASEAAWEGKENFGARLNEIMQDALGRMKKLGFDVLNALTLMDNTLFLKQQKFIPGDGLLHYYLYNWRTAPIQGGITTEGELDTEGGSGIGLVML
ncbi:Similar to Glycylpeptide N-tetradecanoyltransferase; acc. no. Q7S3C8 [Pyronema omphalodes CBS 100304]|uniref:Glycylpeptide N-tetradecanoyltransferase n=1 Tax=Pyronema omphalodes (strain CBS 100304) TaxID=1076935 RepID=U4LPP9_PYROM|nr:Similar to Glycylpeptide N-tetradecanoyltransferase; acc. no. Q7S3C8 [Pyronema omphalodes CBS 100304]